jgi:thymidylate synthase (FAD)
MNRHAATSYGLYEDLARETDKGGEYGLARELARFNLPANIYTEMYWKIDLRNLLHFLNLRLDGHAQYEVRVYAEVLWQIVQDWMPITANAFRDYVLEAHTFSRQEMEVLRGLVASYSDASTLDTVLVMSGVKNVTERKAFLKALGV